MKDDVQGHNSLDQAFIDRLHHVYGIDPSMAARLMEEFVIYCNQTVEEWVRSRHYHLQRQGYKNEVIYDIIALELKDRRFASEPLSIRQIRRLIYG
ncbi:hypothetical protein [Gracilinema caldarium]|uniref:Uncharacterized protein n=1 Tax=Gracilinema caldarium (strain ATCC 51460 / DSM 7334 / H1) TaxID=744872 RepID=F8F0T1_GRAC1|nr:hypothetical protein [Gracilinema caldarium]AEJ19788.1 hypothetical protein Spica_1645 [Gracilinema caldarium DSM 7334]